MPYSLAVAKHLMVSDANCYCLLYVVVSLYFSFLKPYFWHYNGCPFCA